MKQHLTGRVVLVMLMVAGCSADPLAITPNVCTADSQCGGGMCNVRLGICLPLASKAPALEVWPPAQNNQGWVVHEFPEVKLDANGGTLLPLQSAVSVQGSVYLTGNNLTKELVPARVVAYRDSLIPNRPKVQFETSQTLGKRDGPAQGYVLWVNRGHVYTFFVAPKEPYDALYPPLIKTVRIDNHTSLDFVLEGNDRAVAVTGEVRIGMSKVLLPAGLKVRVRAYRPGDLEQSTISQTTDVTGRFTFKVPAGVLAYTVRVETAREEDPTLPTKPIPAMECRGRVLGMVSTEAPAQDIGTLALPDFTAPDKPFTVTVKGKDGSPVANASVTFTHDLYVPPNQNLGFEGCTASYTQSGMTDAEGKLSIFLLGASNGQNRLYRVTVLSPPTSRFASQLIEKLEVGTPGSLKPIELQARYRVAGQVVCATGKAVASATIEAQAIGSGNESGLPAASATAQSGKDGSFELFVDPGNYNVDVRPTDGTGLPSLLITALPVKGDAEGMTLRLPDPQGLRGQVVAPDGQSAVEVANAQVNVYEAVPDTENPVTYRADLRAHAVSDGTGTFYLLLPSTPAAPR